MFTVITWMVLVIIPAIIVVAYLIHADSVLKNSNKDKQKDK
jgi:uncharacterized membrane protein YecN with MAPEG domain